MVLIDFQSLNIHNINWNKMVSVVNENDVT